jgi:putative endonuclease
MDKSGYVYIMTNKNKTTLYIGVTSNLVRRITEHKNHTFSNSFTDRYKLEYCIYFEEFPNIELAIKREKELKKWNRQKKENLINKKNPEWKVLVTENGFIREKVSFSQQVSDLLNELKQGIEIPPCGRNDDAVGCNEIPPCGRNDDAVGYNEIPPCGRNDGSKSVVKGVYGGGTATSAYAPAPQKARVISSEARNLKGNEGQGSEARNPKGNEGQLSETRNDCNDELVVRQ